MFCEGEVTEPAYLTALQRFHGVNGVAALDIREVGCTPWTLVERASEAMIRGGRADAENTEYWCVFDVEAPTPHPRLKDAFVMARDHGIRMAISDPCFELWLILHYADRAGWLSTADAERLRREHDGSTGKGLDGVEYAQRRADAGRRAGKLEAMHERDGRQFPKDNPSSGMYRLVEAVEPPTPGD